MGEIGRRMVSSDLVRYASNRLLIQDYLRRHPEALEQPIKKPLIVVGLPRSGTTHLVNLLAAAIRSIDRVLPNKARATATTTSPRTRRPTADT